MKTVFLDSFPAKLLGCLHSKIFGFTTIFFIYFMSLLSFFIAKKKDHEVAAKLPKEKASATMRLLFTELNKFLRVCFF
jgi:hypothetical protein